MKIKVYRPGVFSYLAYFLMSIYFIVVLFITYYKNKDETIIQLKKDNIIVEVRIIVISLIILFLFLFIRLIKRNLNDFCEININEKFINLKYKGRIKTIYFSEIKKINIIKNSKYIKYSKTNLLKEYETQLKSGVFNIGYSFIIVTKKKVEIANIREEEHDKIVELSKIINEICLKNNTAQQLPS